MRDAKGPLKKDERYLFYMQFYVQDYSNYLSKQFVRVLICESDKGFFGEVKPEEVLKNKDA